MESNFLYLGLSFLSEKHKVPKTLATLPLSNGIISEEMYRVITEESVSSCDEEARFTARVCPSASGAVCVLL